MELLNEMLNDEKINPALQSQGNEIQPFVNEEDGTLKYIDAVQVMRRSLSSLMTPLDEVVNTFYSDLKKGIFPIKRANNFMHNIGGNCYMILHWTIIQNGHVRNEKQILQKA